MENKIKFTDKPTAQKIVYGAVIAILCVTAVVIGILSAALGKQPTEEDPPVSVDTPDTETPPKDEPPKTPEEKLSLSSPTAGEFIKGHSHDTPVFSDTLEEWRVHTGIDISTADGAEVLAAADGMVSAIYDDPMLGRTVEVTHVQNIKTLYSNLSVDGTESLTVGDTSISELAEEPHLHFEVMLGEQAVNPLDYMSGDVNEN